MTKVTWVGDRHTKEYHRLVGGKQTNRNCQIPEITAKHRREFKTKRAAVAAHYDACAWCLKESKR